MSRFQYGILLCIFGGLVGFAGKGDAQTTVGGVAVALGLFLALSVLYDLVD